MSFNIPILIKHIDSRNQTWYINPVFIMAIGPSGIEGRLAIRSISGTSIEIDENKLINFLANCNITVVDKNK